MMRIIAFLLLFGPAAAMAQAADPAWQPVWDFLVQSVCADGQGRAMAGASPVGCARPRKLRLGEPLPYHKRDWPNVSDRARYPSGYQQSDAQPIMTALGPAVLHTYDFGDGGRVFGQLDAGDGGQVVFFTPNSAAIGVTEDGGAGLQLFIGPACTPVDSWVVVDRSFLAQPLGETVARLIRRLDRCPDRLNQAYTRWRVLPFEFRTSERGQAGRLVAPTLVSEHFDGGAVDGARAMERMYFTTALGYTRWEAWRNLVVRDRGEDRREAAALIASGRCGPTLPGLSPGWVMVDCREWTQIVPAAAPEGDAPFVWLDRLRAAPATAALFGTR